jgi:hypothetical protein
MNARERRASLSLEAAEISQVIFRYNAFESQVRAEYSESSP